MAEFSDKPGYAFGQGPPPELRSYFGNKVNKPSFSWLDVEPEEHAIQFAVAKAGAADVLETIRSELTAALEDGVPFKTFQKSLEPRLQKLGWWGTQEVTDPLTGEKQLARLGSPRRLKTIYDSNMRAARAAGQWDRAQRTKAALPFFIYELGPSEEHRPEHVAKAGIILPVDDPFWDRWFPPNGWGCKCRVRQITKAEAARRGGVTTRPDDVMREWVNQRTGEVKQIPVGLDPGWERNPGRERQRWSEQFLQGKLDGVDPATAKTLTDDMTQSWRFRRVQDGSARGSVPVSMVPDAARKALDTSTSVVSFSSDTAAKQLRRRRDLQPDAYRLLRSAFDAGSVLYEDGLTLVSFFEDDTGLIWQAMFKRTRDGKEIYLTSFHRANPQRRRAFASRDGVRVLENIVPGGS